MAQHPLPAHEKPAERMEAHNRFSDQPKDSCRRGKSRSRVDAIYIGSQGRIIEVACWAHARRKFFEAPNADRAHAEIALAQIAQLYAVEKQLREHLNGWWSAEPTQRASNARLNF